MAHWEHKRERGWSSHGAELCGKRTKKRLPELHRRNAVRKVLDHFAANAVPPKLFAALLLTIRCGF
jgi:hypothetical protein